MTLTNYLQKLDESSSLPLYQQLQRALRTAIEKRVVGPDDALPPERDLADGIGPARALFDAGSPSSTKGCWSAGRARALSS